MFIARLLSLLVVLTGLASASPQRAPRLWGELKPGPYEVGLRVATFFDQSRADSSSIQGRPIHTTLWYPAAPSARSLRLSFADYLAVSNSLPEASTVKALRQSLSIAISSEAEGIDESLLDQILASNMLAVRDAAPVKSTFPLVLWSARHGTVAAQSILSEYLASHGYVVAFARYQGPAMPLPYEVNAPEIKRNILREQVRDLEFALKVRRSFANVDRARKVAVMSWSYAGESATLLQLQNPDVGLVISLSSNVLNGWVYQNADDLAALDATLLKVPYILMTERVATNGSVRTPPAILNSLTGSSYFISFPELAHGNFNATEGMIPGLMGIAKVSRWSKSGPAAQLGYETISRYTLHFLNHFLKAGSKALPPLAAWERNLRLPAGFVTATLHGTASGKVKK